MRQLILTLATTSSVILGCPAAHSSDLRTPQSDHTRPESWRTTITRDWGHTIVTGSLARRLPQPAYKKAAASSANHSLSGIASFYWQPQMTANGERFDPAAMTAAHPTLPFNTRVRVTHEDTGKSVQVRINDRGPFKPGRVIDLSKAAAGVIGMHKQGLARVRIEVLGH